MTIQLPHNFVPRLYQLPFLQAMDPGNPAAKKRGVLVWHRRAGKDKTVFAGYVVPQMFRRVGTYYYIFPTYNQGRKILWDGRDRDGFRFLDHLPRELRDGDPNNTEMKLRTVNGSLLQVIGSDNIDSIVGTNPVGCVFSEYALQDPKGWDYLSPILLENGGWAIFDYTPRGKNHGYKMFRMAQGNPDWFCSLLTVEETSKAGGTMTPEMVDSERKSGKSENFIRQEYFCDFDAAVDNAVFGDQMYRARQENRITRVPWEPRTGVETYWDIGWDDQTAIWFVQQVGKEVRLIDYYEARLAGPEHYIKVIREKPYTYDRHVLPHDADLSRMETGGKSLKEILWTMGLSVEIGQKLTKEEQIVHGRLLFPRIWIDRDKCEQGISALASWHFAFDDAKQTLGRTPVHDWSSHASDSFCLIGVELREKTKVKKITYPSLGIV
jgi:phage terminase large subunit